MRRRAATRQPKVGRLLLIAGPPLAGKSTLMRKLRNRRSPVDLPPELGDLTTWTYATLTTAGTEIRRHGGHLADLVLHVDLSHLDLSESKRVTRLQALLEGAAEIYVFTLWAGSEELVARLSVRLDVQGRLQLNGVRSRSGGDPTRRKRTLLGDPASLAQLYACWFDRLAAHPVKRSWVIDSSTPAMVLSTEREWVFRDLEVAASPPSSRRTEAARAASVARRAQRRMTRSRQPSIDQQQQPGGDEADVSAVDHDALDKAGAETQ